MKCPKCGSNLTIDDAKCPFCEAENPFAKQHRKDMNRLKRDYKETKSDVMEKTSRFNKWSVKIALIASLLAVNLLLLFFCTHSYDVEHFIKEKRASAEYDKHVANIKAYEETENYIALIQYFSTYSLTSCDRYDEYQKVYSVCNNYTYAYKMLMGLKTDTTDEDSIFSTEARIDSLVESMEYMYKWSVQGKYDNADQFKEEHVKCMQGAIEQLEDMVQVYCNLTAEEMDSFGDMSNAKRQVLIEEGLGRNE